MLEKNAPYKIMIDGTTNLTTTYKIFLNYHKEPLFGLSNRSHIKHYKANELKYNDDHADNDER